MDSSHLIANMFGGSGYTKAKNIVLASAEYNQKVMRGKEDEIYTYVEEEEAAAYFRMEVEATYVDDDEKVELDKIKAAIEKYTSDNDERRMLSDSELEKRIVDRLSKVKQQRLKNVVYNIFLFDADGDELDFRKFELDEVDLLFGT